jgi:hypothetical protein
MKRMFGAAAAAAILALTLSACIASPGPTTNITSTSATLNATGSCSGGTPTPCEWYWQWGTGGSYQNQSGIKGPIAINDSNVPLTYTVTGLLPNTTYNWQLCGEGDNVASFLCLTAQTFTTLPPTTTTTTVAGGWSCTNSYPADQYAGCPINGAYYDTNDFTGTNYTGGPFSGGQVVNGNVWGGVSGETQTVNSNSPENFRFINTTNNPSGSVTAFPNIGTYQYTGVIDQYTSLTSSFSQSMPTDSNTTAWHMQDDWFSQPGSAVGTFDYEVMVQTDFDNNGTCGTYSGGNPTGSWDVTATSVNIDGTLWHVCDGQNARNANGSCINDNCGPIAFKLGATEAGRPLVSSQSMTLDLKAIVTWLETHNVPGLSYPYIMPGVAGSAVSDGWEVGNTNNVPETFSGNGFTISATGGAAG